MLEKNNNHRYLLVSSRKQSFTLQMGAAKQPAKGLSLHSDTHSHPSTVAGAYWQSTGRVATARFMLEAGVGNGLITLGS